MSARSAKATERSVDDMVKLTNAQVKLSQENIRLAQTARADSDRAQRFARWMAWSSLAVSVASLGTAVVAILVTLS